jgi:hypothetical protein
MRNLSMGVCVVLLAACSAFGGERSEKAYVGTASLNEEQVTQLLSQKGYTNIQGLHKNGPDWIGSATNSSGQQVNFDIDKDGTLSAK